VSADDPFPVAVTILLIIMRSVLHRDLTREAAIDELGADIVERVESARDAIEEGVE